MWYDLQLKSSNESFFIDPPIIVKPECVVDNTKVTVAWQPPMTKCCVNYYVLEAETIKASKFTNRKKKDRSFQKLYEGPAKEHTIDRYYVTPCHVTSRYETSSTREHILATGCSKVIISNAYKQELKNFKMQPSQTRTRVVKIDYMILICISITARPLFKQMSNQWLENGLVQGILQERSQHS